MVRSQNGWTAYPDTTHYQRWNFEQRDGSVFGYWAANDDVGLIFHEFLTRFTAKVELLKLKPLQCWSYANRIIRGEPIGGTVSNHGSATALDVNSLEHPRGVHNTYSAAELRELHKIRDSITDDRGVPVLRLGEDYQSAPVDGMHVEIDAGPISVAQAADKIRAQRLKDADMELSDRVTLTAKAAEIYGAPTTTVAALLQWSPGVRVARDEIDALKDETDKRFDAIDKRDAINQQTLTLALGELARTLAELKALLTPKSGT